MVPHTESSTPLPVDVFSTPNEKPCLVDSDFRYRLFTVSYSIIFIIGVIANSYVLWVFCHMYPSRRLSEIKIFMLNLTVADLLFLLVLPLWIIYYYRNGDWTLPGFLCNIAGCLFFINNYGSIAFLAVISFNRYLAVTRPVETAQSTARKRGIGISVAIWIVLVACASPFLFLEGLNKTSRNDSNNMINVTRCFEDYEKNTPVLIIHFILIGFFFIIFCVVIFCNLLIIKTLISQPVQPRHNGRMKQKALWMVCAVLVVFVICFVPHHLVHGPWTLTVLKMWREKDCDFRQALHDAHQVTLCLMGMNCVLDPIIYCFLTKNFRKHVVERIKSFQSSRKCSKVTTDTGLDCEFPLSAILPKRDLQNA
ncbi:platelet-activating factor receptor [Protopterus annectens]|uniref:platelet-activating factor receptor n=1 Tax=Protopterus annectens TaxID=7888 RepID=UPI001CFB1B5B|nr:platelet-activating factor receptor [Protopterus annectens]XP_043938974.1 platelet-activating factor receptor [Protopterus annectens]